MDNLSINEIKMKLHLQYAVGILLASLILLIAFRYFDVPDLVDKVTFALTMSSMLLSVLAIFFTINSSNKQESQLTQLFSIQNEIKDSAQNLNLITTNLMHQTCEIPKSIDRLSDKFDSLKLEEKTKAGYSLDTDNAKVGELNKKQVDNIFVSSSLVGMVSLYLLRELYYKGGRLNLKKLPSEVGEGTFMVGYLHGLESCGLLSFEIEGNILIPTSMNPILVRDLPTLYASVMKVTGDDSKRGPFLINAKNKIDELLKSLNSSL
ncbi:MAG: hypothetical protein PHO70_08680 [Candidatus Omnitrophica bacterium]|nr:hypothetical protein [Candidatus Omnitrophota bacterium]